ncbi:MAG: hypothetical protein HKN87_18335 [Saprospiraceae bacterium]|nr:hypothetical protein [Saprospiraceae bacterium]
MKKTPKSQKKTDRHSRPGGTIQRRVSPFFAFAIVCGIIGSFYFFTFLSEPTLRTLDATLRPKVLWTHLTSYVLLCSAFLYFSYAWIYSVNRRKVNWSILSVAFLGVAMLYLGSFNPILAPNGDNAEYLLTTKSLVERGGAYRLHTPNETANGLASLGLPVILSPIYATWGMDLFKMKALIMLFGILIFPVVFFLFRREHGLAYAAILSMLIASSPYLISMSTTIMTEIPYIFWSLLAVLLAHLYYQRTKAYLGLAILLLLSILAAFLTRAVGITLVGAFICYFLMKTREQGPWQAIEKKIRAQTLLKFGIVIAPMVICFIILQLTSASQGVSQIQVFFSSNAFQFLRENAIGILNVVGHMPASEALFSWWKILPDTSLPGIDIIWLLITSLTVLGVIACFTSRPMLTSYMLLALLVIMLASRTPQEMVLIRYLIILLPPMLYFSIEGLNELLLQMKKIRLLSRIDPRWSRLVFIFILFNIGMASNVVNITLAKKGYGAHYESFIRASVWCGLNLPADAYIMSVKPRITHLYSLRKATSLSGTRDVYSADYDQQKIQSMIDGGITHLIVDAISERTKETIYPLVHNHPELFEAYDIPELEGKCTVLRFLRNP